MDAAVQAWLLGQLGKSSDLTDLQTRYTRLGTARAVALEVLYERKAALINDQPASVTVSSVVGVVYTENIKAIERQIALLQDGNPPAPDDPTPDGGQDDTLGILYLRERARR